MGISNGNRACLECKRASGSLYAVSFQQLGLFADVNICSTPQYQDSSLGEELCKVLEEFSSCLFWVAGCNRMGAGVS